MHPGLGATVLKLPVHLCSFFTLLFVLSLGLSPSAPISDNSSVFYVVIVPENIIWVLSSRILILDLPDARVPSLVTNMALIPPGQPSHYVYSCFCPVCYIHWEVIWFTYSLSENTNAKRQSTFKENWDECFVQINLSH